MKQIKIITAAVIAIILIAMALLSVYRVDTGEVALITQYGKIVRTENAGLHLKSPLENKTIFNLREQALSYGDQNATDEIVGGKTAYTKDQQTVTAGINVTYRLTDPAKIYSEFGSSENLINNIVNRRVHQTLEIVFSRYRVLEVSEHRQQISNEYFRELKESLAGFPIDITSAQLIIQFDKSYEAMLAKSQESNVEYQKQQRLLEAKRIEVQRSELEAEMNAKIKRMNAAAEADRVRALAQAEADAIRLKGEMLEKNPNIVHLNAVEKWNGQLPVQMIPGSTVPFVNVGGK
jgi:band 7 protein